jgi:hypothetical protein
MCTIQLPDALVDQIAAAGVPRGAVDEFVAQAVREKLAADERRKEFFRLSDEIRAAMHEQGLTEEQLLAEFDTRRHST